MVENIKSLYFINIVFTNIEERKKLLMIKYNKKLQNIIKINILNYKVFSGKYIIYEKNGNGKEYNDYGNAIFEGEYFNGKKNGIGEQYYDGALAFKGEYINGMKNGKGIEYDYNNKIKFEGEFLNGERKKGKK